MRNVPLFCAILLSILFAGLGIAGDEKDLPGKLVQIDITPPSAALPWTAQVWLGEMVQLSVFCRANDKEDNLRTIKIEVMGDSATMVGEVVEVPVWTNPPVPNPGKDIAWAKELDDTKKHLCCFLKTVKVGYTTVKLTPIGMDGKDRPTREWRIAVFLNTFKRLPKDLPRKLVQIDANHPTPPTKLVRLGDMVQLSVFCRANDKEENLRTIKVELTGDSVTVSGAIVEVPIYLEQPALTPGKNQTFAAGIDDTKKHLSCFLRTEKIGKTTVKLTPIGMDGKDRPVCEWIINVRTPDR